MRFILSTLLFVGVLFYVFVPRREVRRLGIKSRAQYLTEQREVLYDNLRDLDFEFRAGKYSEDDYAAQRDALEHEAAGIVIELRNTESSGSSS